MFAAGTGKMKSLIHAFLRFIRRQMWSFIVAYMLGMHNFYKGEDKTPDNIVITIEYNQAQDDGTPLE